MGIILEIIIVVSTGLFAFYFCKAIFSVIMGVICTVFESMFFVTDKFKRYDNNGEPHTTLTGRVLGIVILIVVFIYSRRFLISCF